MSRFRFKFAILTSRKLFRHLKADSPLRTLLVTIRSELSERDGSTLEFVSDGLNPVYDARFITETSGEALDKWGGTLDLARDSGESDNDYRDRLLSELRDFTASLTAEALKDKVEETLGQGNGGEIIEVWDLAPDWPLDWWEDVGNENVTWCNWGHLLDFLLVLDSAPGASDLADIAADIEAAKFAPTRCLIVTDSGSGYYNLIKMVR